MVEFIGILKNGRSKTQRLGSKKSGLYAEINGWNHGISIWIEKVKEKDIITIKTNGGSNKKFHKVKEIILKEK